MLLCAGLYYNLFFGISPDNLNSNLSDFFRIPHSGVMLKHLTINEFCMNGCFMFYIHVVFI